jgi:deoxyribodipyrimidine photolyase
VYDPTNPKKIKEYDLKLEFIRKYIPELSEIPDKDVFNWNTAYSKYPDSKYNKPIVNFEERKQEWFKLTLKS